MMAYKVSGGTAPVILNLVTRRNSVGIRTGLGVLEKRKNSCLYRDSKPGLSIRHPSHYTTYAILDPLVIHVYIYRGLKSLCAPDDYSTKTHKNILNSFNHFPK
jgi:hypothetical protein